MKSQVSCGALSRLQIAGLTGCRFAVPCPISIEESGEKSCSGRLQLCRKGNIIRKKKGALRLHEGRKKGMLLEKNDTLLFIGDSISDYERTRPIGEGLFNAWGHSYVACAGALLGCMYPELHLRVINMGISGNQVRDLDKRWQTDVMDLKPDWVSVLIGINDVWRQFDSPQMPEQHVPLDEFENTYRSLIERTLPHVKGMILMTPYYMEPNRGDAMRARMDQYGAVVRRLAEEYKLVFVNLQEGWDRLFQHMHSTNIAWDRVHPNQTGCMYIAKQFLAAIGADRA